MSDDSKVLQRILGLDQVVNTFESKMSVMAEKMDTMAEKMETSASRMEKVFSSPEVQEVLTASMTNAFKNLFLEAQVRAMISEVVGGSLFLAVKRLLEDAPSAEKLSQFFTGAFSNDSLKGLLSDGVYHGVKRLSSDGEFQKSMSSVMSVVVTSQETQNVVHTISDSMVKNLEALFISDKFQELISQGASNGLAGLQEVINISVSEGVDAAMQNFSLNGYVQLGVGAPAPSKSE